MSMFDARIGRCLRLMTLLRARTGRRARELAAECGVSERTVYRDLRALTTSGLPIRFDKESGRYEIGGDFFLPPVQLTLGEALALSALGEQLGRKGGVPFLQDAWQAVTNVRSQLPAALREEVAETDGHVRVQTARAMPAGPEEETAEGQGSRQGPASRRVGPGCRIFRLTLFTDL